MRFCTDDVSAARKTVQHLPVVRNNKLDPRAPGDLLRNPCDAAELSAVDITYAKGTSSRRLPLVRARRTQAPDYS